MKTLLITGGAGFIGSHVIRRMVINLPDTMILNLDAMTYAGNLENLKDIEDKDNYRFIHGDITDAPFIDKLFEEQEIDGVIHLAAESHVDRSIADPLSFINTNILILLNKIVIIFYIFLKSNFPLFSHFFILCNKI